MGFWVSGVLRGCGDDVLSTGWPAAGGGLIIVWSMRWALASPMILADWNTVSFPLLLLLMFK